MEAIEKDAATLRKHMAKTYLDLRIGIAVIGAALPLILWLGGLLGEHRALLASMSAYYYTGLRDVFVGALVSVGVSLYLYKGFSRPENWALNIAGVTAVIVALFSTTAPGETASFRSSLHGTSAVILFICIAYVSIFRASDTLSLIPDRKRAKRLHRIYHLLGIAMAVSPLTAVVLSYAYLPRNPRSSIVFFIEAAGVWAFAAYWFTKSKEVAETDAEFWALAGKVHAAPAPEAGTPGRLMVAPQPAE